MASERENTLCNAQCICFKCELLTNSSVPFASLWWSFQWHFSSPGFLPQFSSLLLLKVEPLLLLAHCTPPSWCHMNNYRYHNGIWMIDVIWRTISQQLSIPPLPRALEDVSTQNFSLSAYESKCPMFNIPCFDTCATCNAIFQDNFGKL